jgi:hypothetical protein
MIVRVILHSIALDFFQEQTPSPRPKKSKNPSVSRQYSVPWQLLFIMHIRAIAGAAVVRAQFRAASRALGAESRHFDIIFVVINMRIALKTGIRQHRERRLSGFRRVFLEEGAARKLSVI